MVQELGNNAKANYLLMSINTAASLSSTTAAVTTGSGSAFRDTALLRFAVGLPLLMAAFLGLVPLIGKAAALPFLLLFVPLVFWAAFADTERALYVYCAWCWMDGTIRGLFGHSAVSVLARDILLLIVLIGWGVQRLRTQGANPLRVPPGTVMVILFAANCLLQIANPNSLGLLSSLAGLKMHLTPIPLLFIGYDVFRRREQVRAFYLFLTLATLVIAAVSIAQYLHGPGWTYAHFPGSEDVISQDVSGGLTGSQAQNVRFKPPGTTTFGGGTNAFIGFVLPMTFTLLLLNRKLRFGPWTKAVFAGILFVFTVAMFLNGVRSGLVSGVACLLACSLLAGGRQRIRTLALVAVCLVLGFGAWNYSQSLSDGHVADRFGSTLANPVEAMHQDRATFFDQAADLATAVPLGDGMGKIGAGAGQFGTDPEGDFAPTYFSEAYLGGMIIETGLLGALLIAGIALFFLGRGFSILQQIRDDEGRMLAASLLAILLVLFANFFTSPILFQPPGSVLFWLCGAMLLRVFAPHEGNKSRP